MKKGFTLVEILVGLVLLALVVSLIQGVYSGVTRSRDRAQAQTQEAQAFSLLLEKISDELASAYTYASDAKKSDTPFVITSEGDDYSTLEFTTTLTGGIPTKADKPVAAGRLARVTYKTDTGKGANRALIREETRVSAQGSEAEAAKPLELLQGVSRFRVRWSEDGKTWEDEWDSRGRTEEPLLPRVVSLEVAWQGEGRARGQEVLIRTAIPIYRSMDTR